MSIMVAFLVVGFVALIAGIVMLVLDIRHAPSGYEDGSGFHFTEPDPPTGVPFLESLDSIQWEQVDHIALPH
jgi:hypothetical protein